ncbi:unnamed protein product [Rotaria magnacalcarata]|uniref:C2 domain-containing protein n=1 Tax=Rotaria magnacalcarata TaxID=392030 RepID=A0A816S3H9_9BILA|nr:unnamed protein product [Rotaria magnacalcarata]CAF2080295.1 unnamed protein product [Rotaria magnacalcarata]CAF3915208.1 unnamed protein product [Rotaria magnacalcarata]CAF3965310.1 unnamed protein product [Rotaria magnacalcarata]
MLTIHYDLYIGIGIGAVSVIIIVLIATIIFCKCCVPSSSHRYFGRSVSHYAAINNIDAKTYFKPPQHLIYAPIVHRIPQPPVITQEISSTQSGRTSVASGGRLSILSEKLSRLSISSNQSCRPSVASDSVLLQKKCDNGRLSHSYDDSNTEAITAHYLGRRTSKAPRLSIAAVETQAVGHSSTTGGANSKNIRFQLFPRTSDVVEQSISCVDSSSTTASQPTSQLSSSPPPQSATTITAVTTAANITEEQVSSTKWQLTKANSSQAGNTGRRQSLLRSPSSKYAIPKFPIVGKQLGNAARGSTTLPEQGLLSPPALPQTSSLFIPNKTLRGALGAIMPDLYFVGAGCGRNSACSTMGANIGTAFNERTSEELSTVDESVHRLHIRIMYDDHRNDLIVNLIEAQCLPFERVEYANPYVKIHLRPPVDQKLRQTSVKPQTINPVWNEYFKFGVANETLYRTTKTLYFYIYSYAHSSRPECVGETQIRLTPQTIHGRDLWCTINKQRAEDEYLGELLVSLTYLAQAERLNVGIIEARNLKALSMHLEADPVVRLTLQLGQTDKVKRKKTSVKRNTLSPKWNEELSFNIPGVSLAESYLEIGVYHHDLIAPDEPLGFLRFENTAPISNANIAQHSEIIHWAEVINGGQRAACWHLLRKAARIVPPPPSSTPSSIVPSPSHTNTNTYNTKSTQSSLQSKNVANTTK